VRAQVLTPYIGDGLTAQTAFRPLLADAYAVGECIDATDAPAQNIITAPNLLAVDVTCDAATLAAIEADGRFLILWSDDNAG
jgi:hypothetical protein